jgi:hypothetical protein
MNADFSGSGGRTGVRVRGVAPALALLVLAACDSAPASQPASLVSMPLTLEQDTAGFELMDSSVPPASTPEPATDTSFAAAAEPDEEDDHGDPYAYPAWKGIDLDCADVGRTVKVTGDDPHRLDRDGDGWGCESY